MGQAQINVRTRACSGTFIARTKQAALTHNVRGKELIGDAASCRGLCTGRVFHPAQRPVERANRLVFIIGVNIFGRHAERRSA